MIRNQAGNLFGTASDVVGNSNGVVFQLTPEGIQTILHSFTWTDGATPTQKLAQDARGNLYGAASQGGSQGGGLIYKLDTNGNYTVLYTFCSLANCADGNFPAGWLTLDSAGNIYGITVAGGSENSNSGVVFKLTPAGVESVLYEFPRPSSVVAYPGLVIDKSGNLYGATYSGGKNGAGSIFKLSKQ